VEVVCENMKIILKYNINCDKFIDYFHSKHKIKQLVFVAESLFMQNARFEFIAQIFDASSFSFLKEKLSRISQ
jgi:hypothetical protein